MWYTLDSLYIILFCTHCHMYYMDYLNLYFKLIAIKEDKSDFVQQQMKITNKNCIHKKTTLMLKVYIVIKLNINTNDEFK